jgi:hypothetical protein
VCSWELSDNQLTSFARKKLAALARTAAAVGVIEQR